MVTMYRRASAALAVAVTAMGLSACAGPRSPITLTMTQYRGDVALGKPPAPSPLPPLPAVNPIPIGFPSFIQPPPPIVVTPVAKPSATAPPKAKPGVVISPAPLPSAAPPPCPTGAPQGSPRHIATNNVTAPPAAADFTYRDAGTYAISSSGGPTMSGRYPTQSQRSVSSTPVGDGTYLYTVKERMGLAITATTYHLDPAKGLYLREIDTTQPDGSIDSFVASTDTLQLLPLPVTTGATVSGSAVDSRSATTLTWVGTVAGHALVNACGTTLDAIEVDITDGQVSSPSKQTHFTATYDIGTQYGALSLAEHVQYDCNVAVNQYCDNGREVVTDNTATITREPALTGGP